MMDTFEDLVTEAARRRTARVRYSSPPLPSVENQDADPCIRPAYVEDARVLSGHYNRECTPDECNHNLEFDVNGDVTCRKCGNRWTDVGSLFD